IRDLIVTGVQTCALPIFGATASFIKSQISTQIEFGVSPRLRVMGALMAGLLFPSSVRTATELMPGDTLPPLRAELLTGKRRSYRDRKSTRLNSSHDQISY